MSGAEKEPKSGVPTGSGPRVSLVMQESDSRSRRRLQPAARPPVASSQRSDVHSRRGLDPARASNLSPNAPPALPRRREPRAATCPPGAAEAGADVGGGADGGARILTQLLRLPTAPRSHHPSPRAGAGAGGGGAGRKSGYPRRARSARGRPVRRESLLRARGAHDGRGGRAGRKQGPPLRGPQQDRQRTVLKMASRSPFVSAYSSRQRIAFCSARTSAGDLH